MRERIFTTDLPRYRAALNELDAKHGCTVVPCPEELTYSLDQLF